MKYTVHGTRMEVVSIEVEADDPYEALDKAEGEEFSGRDVDVWDSNYSWSIAMEA